MIKLKKCLLTILLSLFPIVASAADLTTDQKKELTVFGLKAMGIDVGVSGVKEKLSGPEIEEMVATGLNLNGHLCAKITDICPLGVGGAYEVTCVAYRGGTATKSYVVDALNGVAFVP